MATIYHSYYEIKEKGIFQRVDSRNNETTIYINEGSRPRSVGEFEIDYDVDGDDAYMQDLEDKENAPYVSYEKIDELENVLKYVSEPEKMRNILEKRKQSLQIENSVSPADLLP